MRINSKIIKILALLEQGPKYGRQIVEMAPELFYDTSKISVVNGKPATAVVLSNVYSLLNRMEKGGVIKHMAGFHPEVDTHGQVKTRKWYSITSTGRKELADARSALEN